MFLDQIFDFYEHKEKQLNLINQYISSGDIHKEIYDNNIPSLSLQELMDTLNHSFNFQKFVLLLHKSVMELIIQDEDIFIPIWKMLSSSQKFLFFEKYYEYFHIIFPEPIKFMVADTIKYKNIPNSIIIIYETILLTSTFISPQVTEKLFTKILNHKTIQLDLYLSNSISFNNILINILRKNKSLNFDNIAAVLALYFNNDKNIPNFIIKTFRHLYKTYKTLHIKSQNFNQLLYIIVTQQKFTAIQLILIKDHYIMNEFSFRYIYSNDLTFLEKSILLYSIQIFIKDKPKLIYNKSNLVILKGLIHFLENSNPEQISLIIKILNSLDFINNELAPKVEVYLKEIEEFIDDEEQYQRLLIKLNHRNL